MKKLFRNVYTSNLVETPKKTFIFLKRLKLVKEIPLEVGFIEEMRTAGGNKEMPQTFFHNPPHSRKHVLIRAIGNPAFRNFVTSQKIYCRSVLVA